MSKKKRVEGKEKKKLFPSEAEMEDNARSPLSLSPRERRMLSRYLDKDCKSLAEAGRVAGYAGIDSTHRAFKKPKVQKVFADLLRRAGIDDGRMVTKLDQLLEAKNTTVTKEGAVVESQDNRTQLEAWKSAVHHLGLDPNPKLEQLAGDQHNHLHLHLSALGVPAETVAALDNACRGLLAGVEADAEGEVLEAEAIPAEVAGESPAQ